MVADKLITVDKDGTIEDLTGGSPTALMACLGHTRNEFRVGKQAVLRPPPEPAWWVRLDFKAEDSPSAAPKWTRRPTDRD